MVSYKLQKERPLKDYHSHGDKVGPRQNKRCKGPEMGMYKIYGKNEKIQVSNSGSALGRTVVSLDAILNLLYLRVCIL